MTFPALVRACHPEPAAAVTVIAGVLAASTGAPVARVTAAFASGQLVTGWANDRLDVERDRRSRRQDKPLVRGDLTPSALTVAGAVAAAGCVPLSLALGRRAGTAHLAAVASALAYDAGLKAGALSPLPYAVSFALLPRVVTLASPARCPPPWWATVAGSLLGVGAHFANALPDLADDAADGVVGLPHRLGRRPSAALSCGLLVTATAVLGLAPGGGRRTGAATTAGAALAAVTGAVRSERPGSRAAFRAAVAVAVVDVVMLVARGARLVPG